MSLNHAYISAAKFNRVIRFPSKEYKQLESKINLMLREYKNDINKLNKYFDPKKHCIHCSYRFYMPILKKDGTISMKSLDLSNCIKVIEDIIFKQFQFDDSQISFLSCEKIHSDVIRTVLDLKITEL
jgi:hypothetical protein